MSEYKLSHLQELEAESIHIIREVAAEFENPVGDLHHPRSSCRMRKTGNALLHRKGFVRDGSFG